MSEYTRRTWMGTTALAGLGLLASSPRVRGRSREADTTLIPAGLFPRGTPRNEAERLATHYGHDPSWLAGEVDLPEANLPAFFIDTYPVTNRRYRAFVDATGHRVPSHWTEGAPAADRLDHPVCFVDLADARAFAAWAGKTLPTSAQWEKAARGTDGRRFPWGNDFDPAACRWDTGGASPPQGSARVDAHPRGASPYGVMDLAGNIAEWCEDGPAPGSAFIRGGCWLTRSPLNLRCAAVGMSGADNNRLDYIGFRCIREVT